MIDPAGDGALTAYQASHLQWLSPVIEPDAREAAPQGWLEAPLELLLDELPLGILQLDQQGMVQHANAAGELILQGAGSSVVNITLSQMCERAKDSADFVETTLSLAPLGEVRVLLSRAPCIAGYLAVLERNVTNRLRAENAALRAMLSAATQAMPPKEAAHRALVTLGATFGGSYLVLYELDEARHSLLPMAHVAVPAGHSSSLSPRAVDSKTSLVGRVMATGKALHVANLARSFFPTERALAGGDKLAAIALPVVARGTTLGVLYVCGPSGLLGEGELKLLQGLADAVGTLIEHARQEAALAREQKALASLMNNLPDAVLEQGTDGLISVAGGRLKPILGREGAELLGRTISELLIARERPRFMQLISAIDDSAHLSETFTLLHPDGAQLPCEVSIYVSGVTGAGPVVRAVFRDISARLALEAEVHRARSIAIHKDRLATIGQLAAGVSHEINNPLSFVKANLSFIEENVRQLRNLGPPEAEPLLKEIDEMATESLTGVDRIVTIIQSLKGMARNRLGETLRFDPARSISDAVTLFRRAKKCGDMVKADIPALPFVLGEPGGLGQVVLNLLENAVHATGGRSVIHVRAASTDSTVRLQVIDQGPGISVEAQKHIFEPFFTTKDVGEGTGLGLYLCQEIIRRLGGTLTFETSPQGTTFTVELKVEQQGS